ncbi:ABC transporter G family member 40 isoform X2 [Vigna radiata var. radiata]|uniref:ABC transporter G family member 40 isoform X2 n=1 Tax=Vigna radiata var. radiata TaxID=3916 RepID=A0A1S3U1W4_VIGRR|nr:ABC transporter G family member 40 isoform X2 [Vigna radiata var. radiata]
MANGSLTKATSSFQVSRSSIWRDGSAVFSRNSFEEDDEEALMWAALEKLPTYNRLRKGLLVTSNGEVKEIDVTDIGTQERKHVLERLVRDAEEDNEKFLLKLRERIDRVGISFPTIEARFEHLNVEAEAYVGSRALPTFFNFIVNTVESYLNHMHILSSKKKHVTILKDVSGIVKPRRMTLLLGPPSSGKTTLLLALAGKLDPDLKVSGRVTYNGHEMNEFVPQRTAAYISQLDVHIGEMTVRETLAFSARCQGVGSRYDLLSELSRREIAANIKPDPIIDIYMKATASKSLEANQMMTEYILKILGLEMCADIVVGDETLRGVSGGQRKRVTTGEMLVGPTNALFMDEISSGLDSSTTVQIIKCLRQIVHILDGTAVISLLQPEPETYELFDDIILLSNGQIVYQGPREFVLEFFESMGFRCPERKAVADFLQEVTSKKDQQQYWIHEDEPYSFVTVNEFAKAFQCFHVGIELREELAIQFDKTKNHPAALTTKKYGVDMKELLRANFSREYLLMKRNAFVHIFKLSQLAVMAVITMTVFLRTEMHKGSVDNGGVYTGALFFSIVMVLFNGMADISMNVAKLPIFYKQRDLLFYPAWAYAIPNWILKIPITLAEVVVWVSISYYVIGFDPSVGRFFKQYLLLLLLGQMASALFRTIAATGRNMIIANTFGSFATVTLLTLGGFILSREDVKKWWTWGYWISPIMYEQNAMMVNEFLGQSWSHVLPNSTESLGVEVLKSRGFFTHASWYWIGAGALLGFVSLLNITFTLALTFLNPLEKPQAIILKESHENKHKDKTLQDIGLPLKLPGNVRPKEVVESSHRRKKGMILPFEPHSLTFDGITYSVDMPQEMKNNGVIEDRLVLLKGVSGAFRPGVLTALMGVSGAGKTTLLDVLAGRKTGGYIEGRIRVSGYPKRQETYARISGYCEQNDIHSPHVTVYESLLYSAWLRLSPEVNSETRKMFIEEVMELVELNSLREALVGLPGVSGLSTEQRKRLTIAVELVANPSIIFMDEPTSGLDARAAAIVMRTVRNIVDTGRTIVCTIHQPSINIFEAFDELFLLKRGGQEIYVGPLGRHSNELIEYFERIEGVGKIKDGHNPAAWMLEITTPTREMDLNVDFADIYKNSELYRRNKEHVEELSKPASGSKELHFPSQYAQPFFIQCKACLWKQHWSYWRNPPYTAVKFLFTTFVALMFGTMFWDLGSKTRRKQDLFNAIGSMYNAILFLGTQNAFSVQPVVAIERTVFYRERAAGMYSAIPYALAQVVIEIPYTFVQAVTYGIIVYAMIGFEWTASKFFWYLFFTYFTFLYYTFYGMMTVAVTPNQHIASIVATSFYGLWNLFSGFVVPQPNIPVWWRWYYWACPVAWTLYGLAASQFGDVTSTVEVNETVKEFMRRYFGYRDDFVGVAASVVVGFAVLFATIFALSVKVFNFERR